MSTIIQCTIFLAIVWAISTCICRIETLQEHDGHYNKNVKSLFFISQNFAVHDVLCKTMMSHNISHEKRGHPTLEIFFSFVDMNAFATNYVPVLFVHIVNV